MPAPVVQAGDGSIGGAGGNGGSGGGLGTAGSDDDLDARRRQRRRCRGAGWHGGQRAGGEGGDGGDGGGLGAGATTSVAFSTFNVTPPVGRRGRPQRRSVVCEPRSRRRRVGDRRPGHVGRTIATAPAPWRLRTVAPPRRHWVPRITPPPGSVPPARRAPEARRSTRRPWRAARAPTSPGRRGLRASAATSARSRSPPGRSRSARRRCVQSTRVGGVRHVSVTARNTACPGSPSRLSTSPARRIPPRLDDVLGCAARRRQLPVTVAFTPTLAGARRHPADRSASFPLSGKGVPGAWSQAQGQDDQAGAQEARRRTASSARSSAAVTAGRAASAPPSPRRERSGRPARASASSSTEVRHPDDDEVAVVGRLGLRPIDPKFVSLTIAGRDRRRAARPPPSGTGRPAPWSRSGDLGATLVPEAVDGPLQRVAQRATDEQQIDDRIRPT